MRIVLDTNILVRAFVSSDGLAYDLVQTLLASEHVLVISNEMLAELTRVLRYSRLQAEHCEDEEAVYDFAGLIRHTGELVPLNILTVAPIRDPADVIVLQTAICGEAKILCTMDRDFYAPPASIFLAEQGITVLTDAQLIRALRH